jgi:outer membrane lipoprotein-sorting protein
LKKEDFMMRHLFCAAAAILLVAGPVRSQDAREIVKRANDLMRGTASYSEFTMTVVKPEWSRSFSMKAWGLEPDYALVYVTSPARDRGSVTLKRKAEVWNWLPSIQRVIKIPPSMMLASWMGSDFTNDDLVRQSSIVEDYTHQLLGEEMMQGLRCYRVQLTPKPEAAVVWGKVIMWISTEGFMELRTDFFDEEGHLSKSFLGSNIRVLGGRRLPVRWEMVPADGPGQKTVLEYQQLDFSVPLTPSFFSEQNMKKVR